MNSLFLFVASLLHLAYQSYEVTGLASLSVNDLDFARSVMMDMAKTIVKKPPIITTSTTRRTVRMVGGFRRRRRTSRKVSPIKPVIKPTTTKQPSRNLNKFNEAMDQVERAMTQAQHARKSFRLTDLKKGITDAVNHGNLRFARRALGQAFYTARKSGSTSSGRGKRSATTFLADIKKDLGDVKFSDFLALQGEVTLMYAMDITGSMAQEIDASKNIVTEISRYKRSEPVDYILSSFGDPISQGTVVYKPDGLVDEFIQEVGKLKAHGGLDCAEYAYEGMLSALYEDPRWGSPLYVFTDAPPKDATTENKEALRALAEESGITINFFVGINTCTQSPYKLESFNEEAELHGGLFMRLTHTELKSMAGFTGSALGGSTAVVSGSNTAARKKRSTVSQIIIPIDDTVSKCVITITTSNSPNGIILTMPGGAKWSHGMTRHTKVIVYIIDSPKRGIWKLVVPSSVGKYSYSAKVSSPENIDFEHYFTKVERGKMIDIRNPLAGELANVNLTISGVEKIAKASLKLSIIATSGKLLVGNLKPIQVGLSGRRYYFTYSPPNEPHRFLMSGSTLGSKFFQRISRNVHDAKLLVLKEFYNSRSYTIKQGGSTTILLYLFNGSNKMQSYTIISKGMLGYKATIPGRQVNRVSAKRKKIIRVSVAYGGGNKGRKGQTVYIIVIVQLKGSVTTEVIPLMVV